MGLSTSAYRYIAKEALKDKKAEACAVTWFASILGSFATVFSGALTLAILSVVICFFFESIPNIEKISVVILCMIALVWFFIGSYVRIGYINYNLAFLDRRKESINLLFGKSTLVWKAIWQRISIGIVVLLGSIFFLVPGIIFHYSYAMTPYLLEERHDIDVAKAMRTSRRMMKGHKFQLFSLRLSFLGWKIVGVLTLGIGMIFIRPYYYMSETAFFNEISGRANALYQRD